MTIKELRALAQKAHEAGEDILREARESGWNPELDAKFDRTTDDLNNINKDINAAESLAASRSAVLDKREERLELARDTSPSVAIEKARNRDIEEGGQMRRFMKYLAGGFESLTMEDRALYDAECRSLNTATGAAGGFLIPEEMQTSVTEALLDHSGILKSKATVFRTRSGNPLTVPQVNDTANPGVIKAEGVAVAEDEPVFTELVLGAYVYSSAPVTVTNELLNDNEIQNFEAFLGNLLGTRVARVMNTDWTLGAGTTEPRGIVPGSALGVTTVAVAAITKDEILDLIHSVDPGYGQNANSQFMMNYKTLGDLRKLETTTEEPTWNQIALGTPATLYGMPIIVNADMADQAATAIPILFGDMSAFLVRMVWPIRVTRTTELYWAEQKIGVMALSRTDSAVNNAGTAPIKHALNAAI